MDKKFYAQANLNKDGHQTSYTIKLFNGRNRYGVLLPYTTEPFKRDTKKYPFTEKGDAEFAKAADRFGAILADKNKRFPLKDTKLTYEEYSYQALKNKYASNNLARSTYERYLDLQKQIVPIIGHLRMKNITPEIVEHLQTELLEKTFVALRAKAKPRFANVIAEGLVENSPNPELIESAAKKHKSNVAGKIPITVLAKASGLGSSTIKKMLDGKAVEMPTADKVSAALGYKTVQLFEIIKTEYKLSDKTVKEYMNVVSGVFTQARKAHMVEFNPVDNICKVKVVNTKQDCLTPNQINAILSALVNEPIHWKAMAYVMIFTGFRRGEVCGLTWDEINFETNAITAKNEILSDTNGKMYFKSYPKSSHSERTVLVNSKVIGLLQNYKQWREEHGGTDVESEDWKQYHLIFINPITGKPYSPDSFNRYLKRLAQRYDLPSMIHPHAFRHAVATAMLEKGVDISDVANTLGHESPEVTRRVYDHTIKKVQTKSAEVLGEVYIIPDD